MNPYNEYLNNVCHIRNMKRKRLYREHCRISILTCGDKNVIGFCNTSHVDKKDTNNTNLSDIVIDKLKEEQENKIDTFTRLHDLYTYTRKYIQVHGIGISTTCGYKICFENPQKILDELIFSFSIKAYFIFNGLRCCFVIKSGLYHNFRADCFSHQTSVPIIISKTHVIYKDTNINILAWGAGGAPTENT